MSLKLLCALPDNFSSGKYCPSLLFNNESFTHGKSYDNGSICYLLSFVMAIFNISLINRTPL